MKKNIQKVSISDHLEVSFWIEKFFFHEKFIFSKLGGRLFKTNQVLQLVKTEKEDVLKVLIQVQTVHKPAANSFLQFKFQSHEIAKKNIVFKTSVGFILKLF